MKSNQHHHTYIYTFLFCYLL